MSKPKPAGRKEMAELMRSLELAHAGVPSNMEFAAKSLTEHVENVVTKARADIEGMAMLAAQEGRELGGHNILEIEESS